MKIYARPENCSSLVVKKCNKKIWEAHLTSRDRAIDLRFQNIQTVVLKRHHCYYSGYKCFSKAEKQQS